MKRAAYEPSAQQIALAEEKRLHRQAKKLRQVQESVPQTTATKSRILARPWVSLVDGHSSDIGTQTVKVMTWNILAQCLVRSELFPTSDKARKANEREPMIHAEVLSHDADILCMQEVDRLDKLLPMLQQAGYSHTYAAGPEKPHGCLIAYKKHMFQKVDAKVIQYDTEKVRQEGKVSLEACIGSSHRTKNIGLVIALQRPDSTSAGYIVATTHLFWHPAQAGILLREVIAFQKSAQLQDWPCIIGGDFNFAPDDPVYSLLVGDSMSDGQRHKLQISRVVHTSIDPTLHQSIELEADEGDGQEEADPDKIIRNSRSARPSDGLLSDDELSSLFPYRLRSAYDEGQRKGRQKGLQNYVVTYGDRMSWPAVRLGAHEPMWTSYTHYWKTTLDYIFIFDPANVRTEVTGYVQPHRTEDVAAGLPQIEICGSDHFSLCTQLATSPLHPAIT
ncbi:Endonuclease/exonuclease/phosphatase [Phlebopus sp. FC_14]|nr:Endonuclease/exonuclease/phosphatase [Phlebopus sp. FC_14]